MAGPISAWKWVLGVNLWEVIHADAAFLPAMLGQGEGHFVNTASIAGLYPDSLPRTTRPSTQWSPFPKACTAT